MMQCGLLGKTLGHSYSPLIHGMLGEYDYQLYEKTEGELEVFLKNGDWHGLNVTIPYKKTVMPYLSSVSEWAKKAGSVNTIVRNDHGELTGDNTDVYGFMASLDKMAFSVTGKKVLILGSGGAAAGVAAAVESRHGNPVIISRTGENHYHNLYRHDDAKLIVNATPVGMYPNNGTALVDLSLFPQCEGVLDLIYNPARTALLLQAKALGIPAMNGLYMLVAQAKRSAELFTDTVIPDSRIESVYKSLKSDMQNIVLIGMPGVGKSTVGKIIGECTGRKVVDSDEVITEKKGLTPARILSEQGETVFRIMESEVIRELGKASGTVVAVGGGAVLRQENYNALHQNGRIFWLRRDIASLPVDGRPLSQSMGLTALYRERVLLYEAFADREIQIENNDPEKAAREILEDVTQC